MWGTFFGLMGAFLYLFGIGWCFARCFMVTSEAWDGWDTFRGILWGLTGLAMLCFPIALAIHN